MSGVACTCRFHRQRLYTVIEKGKNALKPEEEFAFEVVGRLQGAEVEHYDCGGRDGVVDALLHFLDGRPDAVLEVSSLGGRKEAEIRNVLGRRLPTVPGLMNNWYVQVPADFRPKELELVKAILPVCERRGITRFPDDALASNDQARTLWARGVTAVVVSTGAGSANPRAYWAVRGVGGGPGRGIEPLVDELFEHLQSAEMADNLRKLAKPLGDKVPQERHLFLVVRPTAFSFPVYDALAFGGPMPTRPPRLLAGLSQVWLITHLTAGGVVRAISGEGWRRDMASA